MPSQPVEVRPTELRDARADLTYFKAAVELATKDLAAARRQLLEAHGALADARRLTRLCSWPGLLTQPRAPSRGERVED